MWLCEPDQAAQGSSALAGASSHEYLLSGHVLPGMRCVSFLGFWKMRLPWSIEMKMTAFFLGRRTEVDSS